MKINKKDYRASLTDKGKEIFDFIQEYGLPSEHFRKILGISHTSFLHKMSSHKPYVFYDDQIKIINEEMDYLRSSLSKSKDIVDGVYSFNSDNSYYYERRKSILPEIYEGELLQSHLNKKIIENHG